MHALVSGEIDRYTPATWVLNENARGNQITDSRFPCGDLSTDYPPLFSRDRFFKQVEDNFSTKRLKPIHEIVRLSNRSLTTVPVYDIEFTILLLLSNPSMISQDTIAQGYDMFTGETYEAHKRTTKYSEIHTGDAWKQVLMH